MKKRLAAVIALSCIVSIGAETINYIGSSTVGKFMYEAEKVYKASTFSINTKPESGGGEKGVAAGKADIGGVAREVKQEILDKGVQKYLIGKDAIGVVLNTENSVSKLSSEQLVGIFTGTITNWSEVGGDDAAISVYIVNPQSATRKVFQKCVLGKAEYGGKKIATIRPDEAIIDRVKADKYAIGQLSLALISGVKEVKPAVVDGEAPSVINSTYPIARPLYLITKGEPTGEVKNFIDWAQGKDGQNVVKKYFVGK